MENKTQRSSVLSYLPWLVAAGALILYLITLNRSLSLVSVTGLTRMLGWDWRPVAHAPLFFVLTLPIRWLPANWQLAAGSLFSLLCAVSTLALLVRSVSLLPHDRTREQRLRDLGEHGLLNLRMAWIPPLAAALVCALQMSFWELATAPSGEMLDLLMFAYLIRCLLEYRADGRESWLFRVAFLYGLGTANNWALIGYFPAFLIALVWIMGLSFFRYRFMIRATLWGIAGLLLYLLLPLIQVMSDPAQGSFFEALRLNLGYQKQALTLFRPYVLLLMSLGSLLPLLIISIRWPTSMGDVSAAGFALATLMMYVLHAAFLAICFYTMFDPPMSPRQLAYGTGVPMLSFYYLSALCIGYFCGFFLLISAKPLERFRDRATGSQPLTGQIVTAVICLASVGIPAALFYKNIHEILARNSGELDQYTRRLAESLPGAGAVVLSDDPVRLNSLRVVLGPKASQYVLLDTTALPQARYHRQLLKRYGNRVPAAPAANPVSSLIPEIALLDYLVSLSAKNPVYYLHPSFGYFFERFYQVPRRAVYEMKALPASGMELPPLSPQELEAQEAYWQKLDRDDLKELKLKAERYSRIRKGDLTPLWVASYYSRARNDWGVRLNVNHQLDRAIQAFQEALQLNPHNACAAVNLEWSKHWKQTGKVLERFSDEVMSRLQPFAGNWDLLLSLNGPLDEPTFRTELARRLALSGMIRQTAQQVQRLRAINPTDLAPIIVLGNVYIEGGLPDQALSLLAQVRADARLAPSDPKQELDLIAIEAWAAYAKNNLSQAEQLLLAAQEKYPRLDGGFFTLAQLYAARAERFRAEGKQAEYRQSLTNAMGVFEKQISLQPTNVPAMVNYGGVCAQVEDYSRAVAVLTKAVGLDASNQAARLNRAIAYLRAKRLDEARQDYEYLLRINPTAYRAFYGLGEIASEKQDWYGALNHFEAYLRHAPQKTPEFLAVEKRVKELKKKSKR